MDSFWEAKFGPLAVFNTEKMRGIVHTAEYTETMNVMQEEYKVAVRSWCEKRGVKVIGADKGLI